MFFQAQAFTLMTWNIHRGVGMDGKMDLARIAAIIREQKPDAVREAAMLCGAAVARRQGYALPANISGCHWPQSRNCPAQCGLARSRTTHERERFAFGQCHTSVDNSVDPAAPPVLVARQVFVVTGPKRGDQG